VNKRTLENQDRLKTAIEIAKSGGPEPMEVLMWGARYLRSYVEHKASNAEALAQLPADQRAEVIDCAIKAVECAAKAQPYVYPRVSPIEWVGGVTVNDNRTQVVVTIDMSDDDDAPMIIEDDARANGRAISQ
jgi:hypothetical protein